MKRKLLLVLVTLLPMLASAYDAEIGGIYYNFSGNEAIVTYQYYNPNDYIYISDYSGNVVIPESVTYEEKTYSVTSIGYDAFAWSGLTSVTIPNSVTSIGEAAFYGCTSLTSVSIPNSVTSIGYDAFRGCSSLTSINIPNSVTRIGYQAFFECSGLTSVTIPNSMTSIGYDAFYGCYFTYDSFINNSTLTSEDNWGANLCNEETSDGLLIKDGVVIKCRHWATSITIPNSVTSIGYSAFSGCSSLTSVKVEAGNTIYDSRNDCNAIIETATNTLIAGCQNTIIPNSVTVIGRGAFLGCSGLTSVTIPNSVILIGSYAFYGCKLHNILVKSEMPPAFTSDPFSPNVYNHTSLYIPYGSRDDYVFGSDWYKFINIHETATAEAQLSMLQAYTLMDAGMFTYSVYDPVNDRISNISSAGIDENNPNHSWQVIEVGGRRYLYNLGAKKFVTSSGNSLRLTSEATTIEIGNGKDGIVLGEQISYQWAFVSNDRMNVEDDIVDAIKSFTPTFSEGEKATFDIQGRRIENPQKGINIIRMSDGTTRKVLMK